MCEHQPRLGELRRLARQEGADEMRDRQTHAERHKPGASDLNTKLPPAHDEDDRALEEIR